MVSIRIKNLARAFNESPVYGAGLIASTVALATTIVTCCATIVMWFVTGPGLRFGVIDESATSQMSGGFLGGPWFLAVQALLVESAILYIVYAKRTPKEKREESIKDGILLIVIVEAISLILAPLLLNFVENLGSILTAIIWGVILVGFFYVLLSSSGSSGSSTSSGRSASAGKEKAAKTAAQIEKLTKERDSALRRQRYHADSKGSMIAGAHEAWAKDAAKTAKRAQEKIDKLSK